MTALLILFLLGLVLYCFYKVRTCELPDINDMEAFNDSEIAETGKEAKRDRKARQRTAYQRRNELAVLGHRLGVRQGAKRRGRRWSVPMS